MAKKLSKERKSVVEKATTYTTKKDMIKLARLILEKLDVKMYKTHLYFRQDNRHTHNNRLLLQSINEVCELVQSFDNEVMHQIHKFADEVYTAEKELPILLRNGIIIEGEFVETDVPPFSPFFLDVSYNPLAYDKHVDKFLNDITCGHKELRKTLEEILGHILLTNKFPHHVFFLIGNGDNGKSTFLEMINNFVGEFGQTLSLEAFNDATSVASLIVNILPAVPVVS